MQNIEIEYNRKLKPLEAVLSGVKQPGDFFVCGAMEMPMPRVEVDGAGTLSFPVPDAQIAAIVRRAERAPYGRGEETIVDTSVRNVWQIAPGKVKIGGKSWAANFETILSKVKAGLGCDDAIVSAELYKLLVYDRGGFFLAHRDTEKDRWDVRHPGRDAPFDVSRRRTADPSCGPRGYRRYQQPPIPPSFPTSRSMPTANTRLCLCGKAIAFAWFTTSSKSTRRAGVGF